MAKKKKRPPGRPKIAGKDKRDRVLNIRVSASEQAALYELAAKQGEGFSEWGRAVLLAKIARPKKARK